jgi:hypothetical protein
MTTTTEKLVLSVKESLRVAWALAQQYLRPGGRWLIKSIRLRGRILIPRNAVEENARQGTGAAGGTLIAPRSLSSTPAM